MSVIKFPRTPPTVASPPLAPDEMTALEMNYWRAQIAHLQSETRRTNTMLFAMCIRKALFWGCVLWLIVTMMK